MNQRQEQRMMFHSFTYGLNTVQGMNRIANPKSFKAACNAAHRSGKKCLISRVRNGYSVFA